MATQYSLELKMTIIPSVQLHLRDVLGAAWKVATSSYAIGTSNSIGTSGLEFPGRFDVHLS